MRHISLSLEEEEQVCFVTFNYDTLLEKALAKYKREPLDDNDAYMTGVFKLLKLHGSANWGRSLREDPGSHVDGDELKRWMISRGSKLNISSVYVPLAGPTPRDESGTPVLPAISIPVLGKTVDSFECEEGHLSMLKSCVKKMDKILVIGWAGNEEHFLKLLDRPNPPEYPLVLIVSDSEEAGKATGEKLVSRDLCVEPQIYADGFSSFVGSDEIEHFLSA